MTVATVLDANPHPDLSDFTATIDWGDGSATPGSVNSVGVGTGQTIYIEGEHPPMPCPAITRSRLSSTTRVGAVPLRSPE